jgi:hypothetical protein
MGGGTGFASVGSSLRNDGAADGGSGDMRFGLENSIDQVWADGRFEW